MIFQSPKNPNAHLTVKERESVSFPTRLLHESGLLKGKLLDFGCGLGKDVEFLKTKNYRIQGYDPHYLPAYPTEKFDTIFCNYVLNVLMPEEQSYVLMCISELLKPSGKAYFAVRRDTKKSGFIYNPKRNITVYQSVVKLPFKSIVLTEHCEIYEYQHFNQINKEVDCIFCSPSQECILLSEMATVYSIYDNYPISEGHTLIIPKKHSNNYFELTLREQTAIWMMVNRVKELLTNRFKPDGFNVGFNVNKAGGQTIFHTHIHVIPRYTNDVLHPEGGIRNVIPEKANYFKQEKKSKFKKEANNVLVAILNNKQDFMIAQQQNWYRIPVKSAPRILRENKVEYLALYQTKVFESEKYSIRWYAKITKISIVKRKNLFPNEIQNQKTETEYYKIEFQQLEALSEPIISQRGRRITFIPTSEEKFFKAKEINDIFNDSKIEDDLWEELKNNQISAERQYYVENGSFKAFLDFALFCKNLNIDVECDGDTFHLEEKDVKQDKQRQNDLAILGWTTIRFTTYQIEHEMEKSISLLKDTINQYGGLIEPKAQEKVRFFPKDQIGLF